MNFRKQTSATGISRRDLLKAAGAGIALGATLVIDAEAQTPVKDDATKAGRTGRAPKTSAATMIGVPFDATPRVRAALIGCGGRGMSLLGNFLATDGIDFVAVCDIVDTKVAAAQKQIVDAGQARPTGYSAGDHDYENLLSREKIDVAIIATPWEWHVPMSVCAMENGIHAATEVPAAYTLADCWKLVDTSEKTRKHCVMLENCCYGYDEMLVNNMVHKGALGTLTHAECAYIHDLRSELFQEWGEGLWRRKHNQLRQGNLYPTHGLGPVARYLDINRGDAFDYLVSMSSLSASLAEYAREKFAGKPQAQETFRCGDMNTSLIRTVKGRSIVLQRDTSTPRPYSRINMVCGTKGTFTGYPTRLYLDRFDDGQWHDVAEAREFESPLWTRIGELAKRLGGHGGMDFVMAYRLVECMQKGLAPDMDVYDAAAWSAPGPLSEISVVNGSAPVRFPDFTRGKWKNSRSTTI